ncbi:hypothetical protein HYH03_016880 [Edaphochlamys debaryana]|uniref:Uncharacterized protein n=1 Tax=Edaphochlamys debaryana TaxID=47281 RepID=A0A835XHS5_9CHLO|nr:hypothetical protein HYH03_016880 [Edaphochlamys debaryana]|eukprot:KAG2484338.1 hypothetical protein HYH03_016880 [Edaphochlamys debaryana]
MAASTASQALFCGGSRVVATSTACPAETSIVMHEARCVSCIEERCLKLLRLTRPINSFAERVLAASSYLLDSGVDVAAPAPAAALATGLASMGFLTTLRRSLPPGPTTGDHLRLLRHEFLVVHGSGDYCGMEFIVEPALRQHFAIPHPSPEFALVLSHLPEVFVGGSCRLAPIVQLMCALMADSFARQGLALPPWRKEQAMLSKWMPQPHRLRDTPVLPPPAPGLPDPASPWLLDLPEATAALFARDSSGSGGSSSHCCSGEFVVSRADSGTAPSSGALTAGGSSAACSPDWGHTHSPRSSPSPFSSLSSSLSRPGAEAFTPATSYRGFEPSSSLAASAEGNAVPARRRGGARGLLTAELQRRGSCSAAGSAEATAGLVRALAPQWPGGPVIRVVVRSAAASAAPVPTLAAMAAAADAATALAATDEAAAVQGAGP